MRRVRLLVLLTALVFAFACSKSGKGGAGSPEDALGEGNIPLAEPGSELKDVNFAYDSSSLSASAQGTLRENGRWLTDNPAINVTVEGHCDERGTSEYNMALGERRAQAAYDFLRSLGIKKDRLSTISYGKEVPLDPGHTESAWAKNRRVHLSVKK